MSNVVVTHSNLITPVAVGTLAHVAYFRAGVTMAPRSAFETQDGRPVSASHVGALGAELGLEARLRQMAVWVAEPLLEAWQGRADQGMRWSLFFVGPDRDGQQGQASADAQEALLRRCQGAASLSFGGGAGAFQALAVAQRQLVDRDTEAVIVVAVDSFIDEARLSDDLARGESPFAPPAPPPAEGAAAVLLLQAETANKLNFTGPRLRVSATQQGQGRDDDDAIVDGQAMTHLLRALPSYAIDLVAGQSKVGTLRQREFYLASAREAARLPAPETVTLEARTGRLGAAAGLAATAFAAGALRHQFTDPSPQNALAWAISPDGLRGLALLEKGVQ